MKIKYFPQKIVFLIISILGMSVLQVLLLSIVCDNLIRLETSLSVPIWMHESVNIQRLNVDTIHAYEIEIFPLMDLDGNIIQ